MEQQSRQALHLLEPGFGIIRNPIIASLQVTKRGPLDPCQESFHTGDKRKSTGGKGILKCLAGKAKRKRTINYGNQELVLEKHRDAC